MILGGSETAIRSHCTIYEQSPEVWNLQLPMEKSVVLDEDIF
jgi:hypothetical protein